MEPETVEAPPQQLPSGNGKLKSPLSSPDFERTHLLGVDKTARSEDTPKLRVTVFPRAGAPYPVDVNVQEGGHFRLPDTDLSYIIVSNSVWKEEGTYRALVHEGAGVTVRLREANRVGCPQPEVVDSLIENNLIRQYSDEMEEAGRWSTLKQWGIGIFMMLTLIAFVYMIWQMDSGLDGIRNAVDSLKGSLSGSGGGGGSGSSGGHQPIAPGA